MSKSYDKMSLQKLIVFNEIIKEGSLRKAALTLQVPHTSLSHEIRVLEKALGTTLFVKDKNKSILTEDGKKFAQFTQETLQRFQEFQFGNFDDTSDELTIAGTYGVCEIYLTRVISQFHLQFPHVRIKMLAGREYMDFTSHDCDVVIGQNLENRPDLTQKFLTDFNYYLCATESYFTALGMPEKLSDLKDHKLIIYVKELSLYDPKIPLEGVFIESTSYKTLFKLASQGMGIIPLTSQIINEYNDKSDPIKFVRIFPDKPCEQEKIYFIHRRHSNKIIMIEKLKEITYKVFSELHEKENTPW